MIPNDRHMPALAGAHNQPALARAFGVPKPTPWSNTMRFTCIKTLICAAALIAPIAAHAERDCKIVGKMYGAFALARDKGMSERQSLQIAGESSPNASVEALAFEATMIDAIYTRPTFIAMDPERTRRTFEAMCRQDGGGF
jgi:hypothetical protein